MELSLLQAFVQILIEFFIAVIVFFSRRVTDKQDVFDTDNEN